MTPRSFALRARWVVPLDGPPIENGFVTVLGDRIVAVGRRAEAADAIDLGGVALLPGFVNSHTHLEFSDLRAPLGMPQMPLPDWIRQVVAHRRAAAGNAAAAVAEGMRESARCGVTTIGEIAQPGSSTAALASVPLAVTAFVELIGLSPQRVGPLCELAAAHMAVSPKAVAPEAADRWRPGVSPHAPYSVSAQVVRRVAHWPLAMHLAESPEELQLLATGDGPFRDLLIDLGVWRPEEFGGRRPLDVLRSLAGPAHSERRAPALIVHGNYLAGDEQDFIAARPWMSVIYCPRTHGYFGHEPYPLAEMLRRGVRVAVGTDSRASNPDLSILGELRHVAATHRDVPLDTVLKLGSTFGATALGHGDETGTIAPGKIADLAAVAVRHAQAHDPLPAILHDAGEVEFTLAAGRVVHDPRGLIQRAPGG